MNMLDTRPNVDEFQSWANNHEPSERMRFKDGYWNQINFFRDELFQIAFWNMSEHAHLCKLSVIDTHVSKSIELPVCKIEFANDKINFEMVVSYNFHMFSVSVRCNHAIPETVKTLKLLDSTKSCYCYLYGFPDEYHFSPYDENQSEFSCTINDRYEMWAFMRVITTMIENL